MQNPSSALNTADEVTEVPLGVGGAQVSPPLGIWEKVGQNFRWIKLGLTSLGHLETSHPSPCTPRLTSRNFLFSQSSLVRDGATY